MAGGNEFSIDCSGVAVERTVQLDTSAKNRVVADAGYRTYQTEPGRSDVHLALCSQSAKGENETDTGVYRDDLGEEHNPE